MNILTQQSKKILKKRLSIGIVYIAQGKAQVHNVVNAKALLGKGLEDVLYFQMHIMGNPFFRWILRWGDIEAI